MISNNPMKNTPLTIEFYNQSPLTKERNGIIDDLNDLLNIETSWLVLTETSTNPFELSMSKYKIAASDSNAFIISARIQYMRISWNNRYHAFYWVNKITRSSNDTITLDIELDFLNTLNNGDDVSGSPLYSFSGFSSIEREHVNRFYADTLIGDAGTKDVAQIVDKFQEGVTASLRHIPSENEDVYPDSFRQHWYLVFATPENQEQRHLPEIYLIPEFNALDQPHISVDKRSVGFDMIDRLNSRIIKIIQCPYLPVSYTQASGIVRYLICDRFEAVNDANILTSDYDPSTMRVLRYKHEYSYNSYDTDSFTREFSESDLHNFSFTNKQTLNTGSLDALLASSRYIKDPKLESSEFTGNYIVYDSFVIQWKPENYVSYAEPNVKLVYSQSIDCDSSLLFQLVCDNYESEEYYPYLMASTRKNEVPAYSSDYINYMRNGYNYDRQKQIIGNAISIGGAAIGLGTSALTGNVLGAISSTTALTKSIAGAVTGEIEFNKNLETLKSKAMNISDVNDVSLFNRYGNNAVKHIIMKLSSEEESRWSNIFHYYGYNRAGVLGMPNVTSRVWFNYLKGEIVLSTAAAIPPWLYDKVKTAYRDGVTYFHSRPYYASKQWNLDQTKENFETYLLGL